MVLSDVLDLLRSEGFDNAVPQRLYHAFTVGHLERPERDGAGRYDFKKRHISAIRAYLRDVPRPGRKPEKPRRESQQPVEELTAA